MTNLISKLFLLHSLLSRDVDAAFKQGGLPWRYEHFVFLSAIPQGKGILLKDISMAVFGKDKPSLRRVPDALEQGKLITLKRDAADRRQIRVDITGQGLDVLAALRRLAEDAIAQSLAATESGPLTSVNEQLDRLLFNIEHDGSKVA